MAIPNTRIFGIRIFDTVLSIFVLWIFFFLIQWRRGHIKVGVALISSLGLSILLTFPLAIFFHALFNVTTFLNCKLGLASSHKCGQKF